MNCTQPEAIQLIRELLPLVSSDDLSDRVEMVVAPPFTALAAARQELAASTISLAAQDVFWKQSGAYTGQISPAMLVDAGVRYCIVGHSESRGRFGVPEPDFDETVLRHFGDSDETVRRKVSVLFQFGLTPICCVGETLAERKAGRTDATVIGQTERALQGLTAEQVATLVMAYEPVWAIGTGEVCDAPEADRVCGLIRATVERLYGRTAAERVRIQYGGSVKPSNAVELLAKENIDGALVGGASLKATDFAQIISAAPHR